MAGSAAANARLKGEVDRRSLLCRGIGRMGASSENGSDGDAADYLSVLRFHDAGDLADMRAAAERGERTPPGTMWSARGALELPRGAERRGRAAVRSTIWLG